MRHREKHRTDRIGWLRAAVLGANDGIVSTASLIIGVAAAQAALASAASFAVGAAIPLLTVVVVPKVYLILLVSILSLFLLAILGAAAAFVGGASASASKGPCVSRYGALSRCCSRLVSERFSELYFN